MVGHWPFYCHHSGLVFRGTPTLDSHIGVTDFRSSFIALIGITYFNINSIFIAYLAQWLNETVGHLPFWLHQVWPGSWRIKKSGKHSGKDIFPIYPKKRAWKEKSTRSDVAKFCNWTIISGHPERLDGTILYHLYK